MLIVEKCKQTVGFCFSQMIEIHKAELRKEKRRWCNLSGVFYANPAILGKCIPPHGMMLKPQEQTPVGPVRFVSDELRTSKYTCYIQSEPER